MRRSQVLTSGGLLDLEDPKYSVEQIAAKVGKTTDSADTNDGDGNWRRTFERNIRHSSFLPEASLQITRTVSAPVGHRQLTS
jgi:hypothetical protein